jgi:hypothetical protein
MPKTVTRWSIRGQYFENCNCDVVCPCEVSALGPLKAKPDRGVCDVILAFHLDEGWFGDVRLGGLNVILAVHTPGAMAEGNWTGAPYLDERASPEQRQALGAIFSGAVGGPLAKLAPLITEHLPARFVPITWEHDGRRRRATIPGVLDITVEAVTGSDGGEIVKKNAHPLFPEVVQASSVHSEYRDHRFAWDNTGRNADYTAFAWAGP